MSDSLSARRNQIRMLLESAGSRYFSVYFKKKDGSDRQITVNLHASATHVAGAKTESGKKAVETRKINHPELFNVWDNSIQQFRSINLDTVYRVVIDGVTWELPLGDDNGSTSSTE